MNQNYDELYEELGKATTISDDALDDVVNFIEIIGDNDRLENLLKNFKKFDSSKLSPEDKVLIKNSQRFCEQIIALKKHSGSLPPKTSSTPHRSVELLNGTGLPIRDPLHSNKIYTDPKELQQYFNGNIKDRTFNIIERNNEWAVGIHFENLMGKYNDKNQTDADFGDIELKTCQRFNDQSTLFAKTFTEMGAFVEKNVFSGKTAFPSLVNNNWNSKKFGATDGRAYRIVVKGSGENKQLLFQVRKNGKIIEEYEWECLEDKVKSKLSLIAATKYSLDKNNGRLRFLTMRFIETDFDYFLKLISEGKVVLKFLRKGERYLPTFVVLSLETLDKNESPKR